MNLSSKFPIPTVLALLAFISICPPDTTRSETPGELFPDSKAQPTQAAPAQPATQTSAADDRLAFLMVQLSSVEASINAVNSALRGAGYKVAIVTDKADTYAKGNELMDRNGGGPVAWRDFYGSTARQFAPRDIFGDRHNLQRPAQFDYVYRANNGQIAKANQEIAALGKRVDALLARRKQLESEQSALWATITFESIANQEYGLQPLYRLQLQVKPSPDSTKPIAAARLEAIRAAVLALRTADHTVATIMDTLNTDQPSAYKILNDTMQASHDKFQDAALHFTDTADVEPADSRAMKELLVLSKKMAVDSKNMCDAYKLAMDGDAAGEEERKQTFRGQLQRSLLSFADTTQQLDQSLTKLAGTWNIGGQAGSKSPDALPAVVSVEPRGNVVDLMKVVDVTRDSTSGHWKLHGDSLESDGSVPAKIEFLYQPPAEYDYRVVFTRVSGNDSVLSLCWAMGRQFCVMYGGWNNTVTGIGFVNGKLPDANPTGRRSKGWLENGRKSTSIVKVRKDRIQVLLDSELITEWKTDYSDIDKQAELHLRRPDTIGLETVSSPTVFYSADVTEITGSGQSLAAPAPAPAAAIPLAIDNLSSGLAAEIYTGDDFKNLVKKRVDPEVDFNWPDHGHPEPGMSGHEYSIRWTGVLLVPPGGISGISLTADDGARLTIDGKQLLAWHKPHTEVAQGPFAAGPHSIQLDYWNKLAGGHVHLHWILPADPKNPQVVPATALFHQPADSASP